MKFGMRASKPEIYRGLREEYMKKIFDPPFLLATSTVNRKIRLSLS